MASGDPSRPFEIGENSPNAYNWTISGNIAKIRTKGLNIMKSLRVVKPRGYRAGGHFIIEDTVIGRNINAAIYKPQYDPGRAHGWTFKTFTWEHGKGENPACVREMRAYMIRDGLTLRQAFKALRNHMEGMPPGSPDWTEDELQEFWAGWA